MMTWVNVNDRKPPGEDSYLVMVELLKSGKRFQQVIYINEPKDYFFEGFRSVDDKKFRKITHWMELPKFPDEEKN